MNTMIAPVLALVSWTLVMWAWMYAQRLPAMTKAGIKPQDARFPGALDVLPDAARQAAHNYNHLMEQPTIFYAAALAIFVAGHGDGTAVALAWAYVALRIVHSLVQASVNIVMARFAVFSLSTIVLAVMIVREWARLLG
ncbi:MAPEG family protein [Caulobacter endophyticus]|uniref:MAPEG family protein n=1 Tax=Caulobacter endophyticus TaxID=2172652 RepID=UPI00240F6828|nr:MAPEG family protein [Caulobacter endophyticus]MDG2530460.1 MAPEG family protein [Caulobacter endophyticus]